jgi:putative endopeptidase
MRQGLWMCVLGTVVAGAWIARSAAQTSEVSADSSAASDRLLSGIDQEGFDRSVPAHQDFYLHVNGTWLQKTEIPADQSDYGIFTYLRDESQAALRKLVEEAAARTEKTPGSDDQKVGDLYQSFMNTERLEQLGIAPLSPHLQRLAELQDKQQLAGLLAEYHRLGVDSPFRAFVGQDARKSDEYTVYLSQSGLSLPDRDYYLKDDEQFTRARQALLQYATSLLKEAGHAAPAEAAERILKLETQLAEAQWTRVDNRDPIKTYNQHTAEEVASLLSQLDWSRFADGAGIARQTTFIVRQPSYLERCNHIVSETSLEAWRDYFTFRLVDAYATVLTQRIDELHFDFYEGTLRGVAEPRARWKRGLELLDAMIGELVGKIYVREHFRPEAKERMNELVENLRKAFAQRIKQLDWMSDGTKHQALAKLAKVRPKIGYPDEWKDYGKLEIQAGDLVGNVMRAAAFEYQRDIDRLGGPVDREEWRMNPQTINAYYNPQLNEIVFPAAILQPPFFNLQADDAVNYGAIGAVIGHELSHGFDDKGSRFDGDGNLRNLWTDEDRAAFEARGRQLVEQYSGYAPIGELRINGELTLGENIGDLGGVNVAHTAYRLSLGDQPAPEIDGLTGDQRFFMGYAQIWRRKYRDEELRRRLLTDPHSPARFRVLGIVTNMDAFHEAFSVQPGHPMYRAPEARVRIW